MRSRGGDRTGGNSIRGNRASGNGTRGRGAGMTVAAVAAATVLAGGIAFRHVSGVPADTASQLTASAAQRHIDTGTPGTPSPGEPPIQGRLNQGGPNQGAPHQGDSSQAGSSQAGSSQSGSNRGRPGHGGSGQSNTGQDTPGPGKPGHGPPSQGKSRQGGSGQGRAGRGGGLQNPGTPVASSLFNPGSCVAFPRKASPGPRNTSTGTQNSGTGTRTSGPDTPKGGGPRAHGETVFIDAGHGGPDPGGVGRTQGGARISEARVNLPIAMAAMRLLTGDGYRVVLSRTTAAAVSRPRPGDIGADGLFTFAGAHRDVEARPACADLGRANLLVGLYMNSGGPRAAGSVTGWDAARPFARRSHRFARLLQNDVLGRLNRAGYGIPDGGVREDTQLGSTLTAQARDYGHLVLLGPPMRGYVARPSRMPGALIEPLFITDPFEASVADSSRGQRLIAGGIAEAVTQYFTGTGSRHRG